MLGPPFDAREYCYGVFGYNVPGDVVEHVIRSQWLVDRITIWTTAGATGLLRLDATAMGIGGFLAVGSATLDACLELRPQYLYRGRLRINHSGVGTMRLQIEYAYQAQRDGQVLPVEVDP